jgi:arylsulfatase A-like enzyme
VQFDDAIAPAPITLTSHATMMTGLYPPRHGVRDNGLFRLSGEHTTLAERLAGQGYETAAFVGCFVLDKRFGLAQGFDMYDFQVGDGGFFPSNFDFNQRSAGAVTDAAVRWLDARQSAGRSKPFFMWLHYFDAHVPYQSPLGRQPQFAERPYDAEIAYIDQEFGRLLAKLDAVGLRERTLIALVSDHGEGLREHGESTHGLFVYRSTMNVAFILSSPALFDGAFHVRDHIVSLVDLRPTLEDLLGLEPAAALDGVSLVRAEADPERALYIETKMPFHAARCSPLYGLQRARDKYIHAPEPEYYDLAADPRELSNLYATRSDETAPLAEQLDALLRGWEGMVVGEASAREMTDEEAERLRSLGYMGSAHGTAEADSLPDVKAMMRASAKLTTALQLQRQNRLDEALRTAEDASRECRGYLDATILVAQLHQQMKRPEESVRVLGEAMKINPTTAIALQMAQIYMTMNRFAEMDSALAEAERIEPDNGFIHVMRGDRHSMEGRIPEAIAEYEAAIRIDEHRVGPLVRPVLQRLRDQLRTGASPPPATPTPIPTHTPH